MSEEDRDYPRPPARLTDARGREVVVRAADDDPDAQAALVEMYDDFDSADRAQGIPPVGEGAIRTWLDNLFGEGCLNVVAWLDDAAVGHATLVPDGRDGYELAIFVHQDHRESGIGTALIRHLLGYGQESGVEHVWLTVERWNSAAISLYERVGFETASSESFELEMELDLH